MRPILIELPSRPLFAILIALAFLALARDLWRWRAGTAARPVTSTPAFFLGGAVLVWAFRGGRAGPWPAVPVHAYSVMLFLSFFAGWFLALKLAREDGLPAGKVGRVYLWASVWSIIGARILFVLTNPGAFAKVSDALNLWNGGLVAYGGMIAGGLATWYGCHRRGLSLLRWADAAAPSVVLGTAITRAGCLLNGCDYGTPTDVWWALRFPPGSPAFRHHQEAFGLPADAAASLPVHPTQLYELGAGLLMLALLLFLRRVRRYPGTVFAGWVMAYGVLRPLIEVFRGDADRGGVGPLSTSQWIGLLSVGLAAALWVVLHRRHQRDLQPAPR